MLENEFRSKLKKYEDGFAPGGWVEWADDMEEVAVQGGVLELVGWLSNVVDEKISTWTIIPEQLEKEVEFMAKRNDGTAYVLGLKSEEVGYGTVVKFDISNRFLELVDEVGTLMVAVVARGGSRIDLVDITQVGTVLGSSPEDPKLFVNTRKARVTVWSDTFDVWV